MTLSEDTTIKSVAKSIKIIKYIYSKEGETSIQELCQILNYNRTTVYHILKTIEKEGFVRKNKKTKKYGPGPELFNISMSQKQIATNFFKEAEAIIEDIVKQLNETTCIYARKNHHALCVIGKESDKRLKASLNVGETIPLHATATGKVLLAYATEKEVEEYIEEEGLKRYQKNTLTNQQMFYQELKKIRAQGYATEFEEYEELINAVAVPIEIAGKVNAALVVIAPVISLNQQHLQQVVGVLKINSKKISEILSS
jgi:DNA-binding IclR family transcriptional regulator